MRLPGIVRIISMPSLGSAQVAKLNKDMQDCVSSFGQLLQFYGYNPKDFETGTHPFLSFILLAYICV